MSFPGPQPEQSGGAPGERSLLIGGLAFGLGMVAAIASGAHKNGDPAGVAAKVEAVGCLLSLSGGVLGVVGLLRRPGSGRE